MKDVCNARMPKLHSMVVRHRRTPDKGETDVKANGWRPASNLQELYFLHDRAFV